MADDVMTTQTIEEMPQEEMPQEEMPQEEMPQEEMPQEEMPQEPVQQGGPRIVVNPEVFSDDRDALCVAMNEAFRVIMEMNGFDPVSEPTDAQRRFFADTAYADDETMLRRTILARICTFDTSIGAPSSGEHTGHRESTAPTQEQLEEAVEFLHTVLEIGAPQNKWEQNAVKRILTVLEKAVEVGRAAPSPESSAREDRQENLPSAVAPEETRGDFLGGVSDDEEKELQRLASGADAQIQKQKAEHTEAATGERQDDGQVSSTPMAQPEVPGFGEQEQDRKEAEQMAAKREDNWAKKDDLDVFTGNASAEQVAAWNEANGRNRTVPPNRTKWVASDNQQPQQQQQQTVTIDLTGKKKGGVMSAMDAKAMYAANGAKVRNGGQQASTGTYDINMFKGANFDRATGNWSFADGRKMTTADKTALNSFFGKKGGRFSGSEIFKNLNGFKWS